MQYVYKPSKIFFKVTGRRADVVVKGRRIRPALMPIASLLDWARHYILDEHWSYGQNYCVICGRSRYVEK